MSDPVLKEAMAEIKAIMRKHDIAGQVTLVSTGYSEFLYELSPSWSVISLDDHSIRFRARRKDFVTKQQQRETVENSVHLICQIRDLCSQGVTTMDSVLRMLKEHFVIEHIPFHNFEPHRNH